MAQARTGLTGEGRHIHIRPRCNSRPPPGEWPKEGPGARNARGPGPRNGHEMARRIGVRGRTKMQIKLLGLGCTVMSSELETGGSCRPGLYPANTFSTVKCSQPRKISRFLPSCDEWYFPTPHSVGPVFAIVGLPFKTIWTVKLGDGPRSDPKLPGPRPGQFGTRFESWPVSWAMHPTRTHGRARHPIRAHKCCGRIRPKPEP